MAEDCHREEERSDDMAISCQVLVGFKVLGNNCLRLLRFARNDSKLLPYRMLRNRFARDGRILSSRGGTK